MALVDLASLKLYLRVQTSDVSQDALLTQLLNAATAVVQRFTKRRLELWNYTEYPRGTLEPDLILRQRPIRAFWGTGTLASSTTVSSITLSNAAPGITVQKVLVPGMVVTSQAATNQLPVGTTIASVHATAQQVTLSAAATASATATPLVFGLATYLDTSAFGGQGRAGQTVGPFAVGTQLFLGTDYMLMQDETDGSSRCGLLRRLTGGVGGMGGLDWPWGYQQRRGTLTASVPPAWNAWPPGSVKVQYTAGYYLNDVPVDLATAVMDIAAWIRQATPVGVAVDLDRMAEQTSRLISYQADDAPQLATARAKLVNYREVTFGGM